MEIIFDEVIFNDSDVLNFNIKSNKITCFLGNDNSIGQTILDGIMAVKKPLNGVIKVNDNYIYKTKQTGFNKLRKDLFYLSEEVFCNVYFDKVMDLLEFNLTLYKVENFELNSMLKCFDLEEDIVYKKIKCLSDSELIRIMFLVGFIKKPNIILLDNILSRVDFNIQRKMINFLKKMKHNNDIIIVVYSNDSELALRLCDELYIVDDKNVVISGMKYKVFKEKDIFDKLKLNIPNIIEFKNVVKTNKNVKLKDRDDINDLIKDIYRYVK